MSLTYYWPTINMNKMCRSFMRIDLRWAVIISMTVRWKRGGSKIRHLKINRCKGFINFAWGFLRVSYHLSWIACGQPRFRFFLIYIEGSFLIWHFYGNDAATWLDTCVFTSYGLVWTTTSGSVSMLSLMWEVFLIWARINVKSSHSGTRHDRD